MTSFAFEDARAALYGAKAVLNATPLVQEGSPAMPDTLLRALPAARGAQLLDMVYHPLDTDLLRAAGAAGLVPIDGLVMLIGQARRAFSAFFGAEPPRDQDDVLRRHLLNHSGLTATGRAL